MFFNPPDGSAQDFQDTWVPLNSPDLLLFDCVLRALRASATFPSPDQQQSFVKLLRYIVSRTEAGRERVLADIERAGLVRPSFCTCTSLRLRTQQSHCWI